MKRPALATILAALALGALAGPAAGGAGGASGATDVTVGDAEPFRVLVYSRTTGFRHFSIGAGTRAVRELGDENGFVVDATEDPAAFTRRNLRGYAAVVFLNTTGTILDRPQKRALRRYVEKGGGYVGVHSAADTEHAWPFYDRLVGALFLSHPLEQLALFTNEAPDHPATAHLDGSFVVFDEFYSFKRNPRPDSRVLLTIDEETFLANPNTSNLTSGPSLNGYMGDHPMSWCHNLRRGRSFYTALGHEPYLYREGWFRRHLLGGILTAAREVRANCRPE